MKVISLIIFSLVTAPLFSSAETERTVRIGVIDTGFDVENHGSEVKLCKFGHKDFTGTKALKKTDAVVDPVPTDTLGHGTNVVGLIDQYARSTGVNYCIVVLKFYSKLGDDSIDSEVAAIKYADTLGLEMLNLSIEGPTYFKTEESALKHYLDRGGMAVAAAGNRGLNIDRSGNAAYPAQSDARIIVVGNLTASKKINPTSNWGTRVDLWEVGTQQTALGITLSGTSQATAVATGKLVSRFRIKNSIIRKIAKVGN